MLGGHSNEDKMTRSMEADMKKHMNMRILNSQMEEAIACVRTNKIYSSLSHRIENN